LSEAGSVISLELPGASRTGSVGKPLPHHQVSISRDGEVIIHDHLFLGYLGDARPVTPWYHTGDLGHFDADGYLHITGRKKTVYATAYGRNVAPEWPEGELCGHPLIVQAAVFGEAETCNLAVLVSRASDTELDSALRTVNARLPDYARVRRWLRAEAPFSPANGQANSVGCIRRVAIHRHYQTRIEALFAAEDSHAVL
jgi:long-subunit acyl-CoA synthetase (AMP-forming)